MAGGHQRGYFVAGIGEMKPTVEDFVSLSVYFATHGPYIFPQSQILSVFVDLHYPDAPEEVSWLLGNLVHKKYSREDFQSTEFVQGFFDWLKPQTDALYETIKALQ